ncbi:MAG: COX15/CtaA family protein, partial [Thermomicrobium sp.]|nr:COX15/CtaA family protein [Thermomicrobium sp.]
MGGAVGERSRRLRWLTLGLAIAAYLLIVAGGVVRVAGAGLSCGAEWPLCKGSLVPGWDLSVWIDYGHRVGALFVILLTGLVVFLGRRAPESDPLLARLALVAAGLVASQALLGAVTVWTRLEAVIVSLHLGIALVFLATVVALAFHAWGFTPVRGTMRSPLRPWLLGMLGTLFVLMLSGVYTAKRDAGYACPEWPFCGGLWFPAGWSNIDVHVTHRLLALLTVVLTVVLAWQARRVRGDAPWVVGLTTAAAGLMLAQVFVGAAHSWFRLHPAVSVAHLAVATVVWVFLVVATLFDRALPVTMVAPAAEGMGAGAATRRPLRLVLRDYAVLTKPGVMVLLLVTTACAMLVAAQGLPDVSTLFWALIGGALASGGAAAINHYVDRDIDAVMTRTRRRPLPSGRLAPEFALVFGITLSVLAVYLLTAFVNPVAALLALAGNLFYVFVYSLWLKRRTPQNIVIGGAAGAVPPLVGWAAVTGQVAFPAILMFLLVF